MKQILEYEPINLFFSWLLVITIVITFILSFKEINGEPIDLELRDKNEKSEKLSALYIYKIISNIIALIFIILFILKIGNKYKFSQYFNLFYYLIFLILALKIRNKNINELTYENKMYFIQSTFIYVIFFSNKATKIYLKYFYFFPHTLKEYLAIIFLVIKYIFYVYCLLINISITLSNLYAIFYKLIIKFKTKINKSFRRNIKPIFCNLNLDKKTKNNIIFVLKAVLYLFLCPFEIIINFVYGIIIIATRYILKIVNNFVKKLVYYFNNSSKIIKKVLKISTIISLITVYIIIIYNRNSFSSNTIAIYELVSTVVLIPLIYDSIRNKN